VSTAGDKPHYLPLFFNFSENVSVCHKYTGGSMEEAENINIRRTLVAKKPADLDPEW
jgi:hypothetical protein